MKRTYFYIPQKDHDRISEVVEVSGIAFSEFVRQALQEKIDREQVVGQVISVRDELASLVHEMRQEIGRTRKDLMEDGQRGIELIRQDIGKSMKKNEEMNKTFVLMLGGQVAPTAPKATQQKRRQEPDDYEAPMTIPSPG